MCALLENFSNVHPGLENDGERIYKFKDNTTEVASYSGYIYSLCIHYADLFYTSCCIICFDC